MKRLLLPVDDSIHSVHAIKYIAMMSPILQPTILSLFYVQPVLSDFVLEEAKKSPAAIEELKRLNQRNEARGYEILNLHKERLMRLDIPKDSIEVSSRPRCEGVSRDIIEQARRESVDAIVMGRHSFSRFQDTFIGSTTKNIIEHNADIPVWVIDDEITSKNMLLAVDGSTDSVNALEHVINLMRNQPDLDLTLFHVQPSLKDYCEIDFAGAPSKKAEESIAAIFQKANRQCIDNFIEHAWRKLKEKDIQDERLHKKAHSTKLSIGRAIVEEFQKGGYGTLVVGKRGLNNRFFMGSVSNYLVTHLVDGALWIVP